MRLISTLGTRYTPSGSVSASSNNQVIEGLDIVADGSSGVDTNGNTGVIIRKNRIFYTAGQRGIRVDGNGCEVSDNQIFYTGPVGPVTSENEQAIFAISITSGNFLRNLICNGNGPKFQTSSNLLIQYLDMRNIRGTSVSQGFGGGLSLDNCDSCQLLDFYVKNDLTRAWTGDNVNISNGNDTSKGNHTISRGVIDGNNSPQGAAIQAEQTTGNTITDVDATNMGNQGFVTFYGTGTIYNTCRVKQMVDPCSQGRGHSTAGGVGVCFAALDQDGSHKSTSVQFNSCVYDNLGTAPATIHYEDTPANVTYTPAIASSAGFTLRTPYVWVPAYV